MITIHDLAIYRAKLLGKGEPTTGTDFFELGLPMLGGCSVCEACVAAYNACPSKSGYLKCAEDCIGDDGWETVEEANEDLFNRVEDDSLEDD